MPQPLAICLEDVDARDPAQRYLRCVALVGRQPGLRVDAGGTVVWKPGELPACELWVSADDRLILYRMGDDVPVNLLRAGRSLQLPVGKPVVVLDQDIFEVNGHRLRIHVHGAASAVTPPSPLRPTAKRTAASMAAAVALSAVALSGCDGIVEIRETPPQATVETPISGTPTPSEPATPELATPEPPTPEPPTPSEPPIPVQNIAPIEVREEPPDMAMPEEPPAEASKQPETVPVEGKVEGGE
jgi:hypothetical protein